MANLIFPDKLTERLQKIAERENRSIVEVVENMVTHQYAESEPEKAPADDPLLRIWEMAQEANLTFNYHDTSMRSREILETEYADYLLKRMRGDDVET